MKYIGNILTNIKLDNTDYYNVTDSKDKLIGGIPTLVVGWNSVKSFYDNVDITNWKINNNTYWTFGKREKREKMELDIPKFKKMATDILIKSVKYSFFNVLTESNDKKERLFKSFTDNSKKTVYIDNEMVYILYEEKKQIIGISLRDVNFIGGDIDKIVSTLKKNGAITVLNEQDNRIRKLKYLFKNNLYIIPYVLSE